MAKEALHLVHAEVVAASAAEWSLFQARDHAPAVVRAAGFLGAQRFRDPSSTDPVRFTIAYRAANLGVVRTYLEGGEVGKMRARHEAWLAAKQLKVAVKRELLEENYSVDAAGKPAARDPAAAPGRAAFVVRVRIDPANAGSWSTWYDREHMPKAVAAGSFLRAGRWRVVEDATASPRFVVIYEAGSAAAVAAFRAGKGPELSKEHESRFGAAVSVEREVWEETE